MTTAKTTKKTKRTGSASINYKLKMRQLSYVLSALLTVITMVSLSFSSTLHSHTNTQPHTLWLYLLFDLPALGAPRGGLGALNVRGGWGQGGSFHQPLVP